MCHFFLVKYISVLLFDFLICIVINLCYIGWNSDRPFNGWRRKIVRCLCTLGSYQILAFNGVYLIRKSRPKVCYKKYLGPDWKPDYDGSHCGSLVANHSSLYDAMVHTMYQLPAFIAKKEVRDIPFVGTIAGACGSLFIERGTKNSLQDTINARQKLAEEDPDYDPLVIHAEGGTTNNQAVIKFKRGAFVGLHSIWPKTMRYNAPFQSPCSGIIDGLGHYIAGTSNPWTTLQMNELPVFRPNEYFFQHHQQEGEEKWQTYERVIRGLISEHSGLPLSDAVIEDKFEYKQALYPEKYAKKTK